MSSTDLQKSSSGGLSVNIEGTRASIQRPIMYRWHSPATFEFLFARFIFRGSQDLLVVTD